MKQNNRGITIVEMVVAGGLLGVLGLGVAQITADTTKSFWRNIESQSSRTNADIALKKIETLFVNIAPIQKENIPIESFDETDLGYMGFWGINSNTNSLVTHCQNPSPSGEEIFSIVRFSTVSPHLKSLKTLVPWNDSSANPDDLFLNSVNKPNYLFANAITKDPIETKELLIIDSEGVATKRVKIDNVVYVETSIDPYDNVDKAPTKFKYYQVEVSHSPTFTGKSNKETKLSYTSQSTVYPVSTKTLCVDTDYNLVMLDELTKKKTILIPNPKLGYQITKFKIEYANIINPINNIPPTYFSFPQGSTITEKKQRRCINTIRLQLILEDKSKKNGNPINIEKNIFLYNFFDRQSVDCA